MLRSFGSVAALVLFVVACGDRGQGSAATAKLSYNGAMPFPAVVGEAILLTPAVSRTVRRYRVSPSLPPGLSIDELSGVISGTPTKASSAATYMVSATGPGVQVAFPLVLSVTAPPSGLSYPSPVTATVGAPLAPLSPVHVGTVTHYAVSPSLPPGVVLDSVNGVLSGTPREARSLAPYTITASSLAGSTHFVVVLTVAPSRSGAKARQARPPQHGSDSSTHLRGCGVHEAELGGTGNYAVMSVGSSSGQPYGAWSVAKQAVPSAQVPGVMRQTVMLVATSAAARMSAMTLLPDRYGMWRVSQKGLFW
jgi:hypothetical protein